MPAPHDFLLGEHTRTLDERFRLSLPAELSEPLLGKSTACVIVKQVPGCLSLWNAATWQTQLEINVDLVRAKLKAGKLEDRREEVQMLGRLLSTRYRSVELAARGRLLVPEGFREFLQAEPGSDVFVVGAGVCIEVWNPKTWLSYLEARMPDFQPLLDRLSG